ncbi:MAG: FAD-dependent monooxygenase [Beijerinckiaceae bacterium]
MSLPILIAGAGIAGLSAALALARTGRSVVIFEKAPALAEAGAGIQLSPNASGPLARWGVIERLRDSALEPRALLIRRARDGVTLARLSFGDAASRWGAPYLVAHRADVQRALLETVAGIPAIELRRGVAVSGFAANEEKVAVGAKHGLTMLRFEGDALVGADGLWSNVRHRLGQSTDAPWPAGRTAWRAMIPTADLPPEFAAPEVNLWMGRSSHLVHYPLRGGTCVNVVAIVEDKEAGGETKDFWNAKGDPRLLRQAFTRWDTRAQTLLAACEDWRTWPLFDRAPLAQLTSGRITLVGDAAHPMLPFLAQGAAQAIEDAAALERAATRHADIASAFAAYASARVVHVARVQAASRRQGEIYHMSGAAAFARDLVMRALGNQRLLARQDWLYRHQH